jgi:hypothetical protein
MPEQPDPTVKFGSVTSDPRGARTQTSLQRLLGQIRLVENETPLGAVLIVLESDSNITFGFAGVTEEVVAMLPTIIREGANRLGKRTAQ